MLRILCDQNIPRGLRSVLTDYEVKTALLMGCDTLGNGELIAAAEQGGFDLMLSADQNIRYQQNLTARRLALVVLGTNHWDEIRPLLATVLEAVKASKPGSYTEINLPRSALRRRPHTPSAGC